VFVHISAVERAGMNDLKEGQKLHSTLLLTSAPANHLPGTSAPFNRLDSTSLRPRARRLGAGAKYQPLSPKPHEPDLRIPEQRCEMPRLAELSNERDRRALVQMAADWHALADKVRQREANPNLRRSLHRRQAQSLRISCCGRNAHKKTRTPVHTRILEISIT
jgi:hypothetical protein